MGHLEDLGNLLNCGEVLGFCVEAFVAVYGLRYRVYRVGSVSTVLARQRDLFYDYSLFVSTGTPHPNYKL